jgi:ubiquinone/menaquinone biosynthesis C-methylase UbiE
MAVGKEIETRGHIVGFKDEINSISSSHDEFFTWFDDTSNADTAFIKGSWDFALHIAQPLASVIVDPDKKIALEIGHGGGRILASASKSFEKVYGIDIHNNNNIVEAELKIRGVRNFELLQTKGDEIPLKEETVDVVYSFIVLQHVEKYKIFESYLEETFRVLKPGGIALIYFGRKCRFSLRNASRLSYWIDRILEKIILPKGYQEIAAKVNCTNLFVSLSCAKHLCTKIGFKVIDTVVSHKDVPNNYGLFGGQHGLILKKTIT